MLRHLRRRRHNHFLRPSIPTSARPFSTSYKGRITRGTPTGRDIEVAVSIPSLVHDARGGGHTVPRRDLVCRIAALLNRGPSTDPFLDLPDRLRSLTPALTPSEASEVLKALKSPRKALDFFHYCSTIPKFRHDCFTYNRILTIVGKAEDDGGVERLVEEMEKGGVKGSISTVNILIGLGFDLGRCMGLVKKWGLRFNGYTYKCILQAHLRKHNAEAAVEIYEEMRRKGHSLDIFAYNMLLDALAKADMLAFSRHLNRLNKHIKSSRT